MKCNEIYEGEKWRRKERERESQWMRKRERERESAKEREKGVRSSDVQLRCVGGNKDALLIFFLQDRSRLGSFSLKLKKRLRKERRVPGFWSARRYQILPGPFTRRKHFEGLVNCKMLVWKYKSMIHTSLLQNNTSKIKYEHGIY